MQEPIDILLVDDEARNLDALEAILAEPGYRLLRAEDADQALRLLLHHDVAAIVLDIKMPGVSGFELAQLIKGSKKFRQIPIVFLTAHMLDDQDVIAGYGAGAVDYLTKPVNPQILRHKIAVFADLFRKTRALVDLNEKLEERVQERTAKLEESEHALQIAGRRKDEFLATLGHELRNPLVPLRTGLDLLLHMQFASPVIDRSLGAMNRQLDHMVRLIDDLLDVSRISRGVLELKKERADIAASIDASIETCRPFFDQRRQHVSVDAGRSIFGFVDPTRVSQILGNLLHNAAKYTPAGGEIRVELAHESGNAIVRIIDSGMGIPPDLIVHVFDMFSRIDRSVPGSDTGLGIGLAFARRLAEMHGGALTASSSGADRGSTFTLSLPGADEPQEKVSHDPDRTVCRSDVTAPLDILVIEDNEDVADTLASWLEAQGHKVGVARSGPDGIELVQQTRPDVVLCDIGLPGMDGVEVCRRVRRLLISFRPVMVALTGWGGQEDRLRTQEAGFDHHLVKPVALNELRNILQSVGAARLS